jgi:dihydrofolate synthase/folylpolyglutamate synthase
MLNCGVVLLAIEELKSMGYLITDDHVKRALEDVKWPGRMELISSEPLIIIDGAHNMDGAINLRESMEFYFKDKEIILILGILGDKDVESIASVLSKNTKITLCITPEYYRGKNAKELYDMIKNHVKAESCDTYDEAVRRSLELYKEGDIILVAGSLYIIGDMEKAFKAYL